MKQQGARTRPSQGALPTGDHGPHEILTLFDAGEYHAADMQPYED